MTRTPMRNRRQNETRKVVFQGWPYFICVGYDDAGRPREVFADGSKQGSDMQAVMRDACIVISIALQHDVEPAELARSLGTVPALTDGNEVEIHASIVGAIVECLEPRPDLAKFTEALHV